VWSHFALIWVTGAAIVVLLRLWMLRAEHAR
jgi:hypothetical protein